MAAHSAKSGVYKVKQGSISKPALFCRDYQINNEFGVTVLIVEQKVREVLEVCHHVYSIKLGKIAYSGKPEIIKNDKNKLRELFL